jgi:hypothetical protein
MWLVDSKGWMKRTDLEDFWGSNNLKVNCRDPDTLVPTLLQMAELHNGKAVRKEVYAFLLAYKLRNYGGHNIHQQDILTEKYEEIIKILFMALFLSIQAI